MSVFRNKYYFLIAVAFASGVLFSFFSSDSSDQGRALLAIRQAGEECPSNDRTKSILCLKKRLAPLVRNYGIRPFMEALWRDFEETNFYAGAGDITRCHDIAHAIGQVGGESTKSLAAAVSECTEICTYGCYHGAVEGYLARGGDFVAEVPNLCPGNDQGKSGSVEACLHGLGHGAASVAGFDLYKSLAICDLTGDNGRRMSCSTGVLMELYEPSTFSHPLLEFPPDIFGFCSGLKSPYDETCLLLSGLHEYGRSNDIGKAFDVCERITNDSRRSGCFKNIGGNLYFSTQGNAEKIKELCLSADSVDTGQKCLIGAVGSSIVSSSDKIGGEICAGASGDFAAECESALNYRR